MADIPFPEFPESEPLSEATHEALLRIGDVMLRVYTLADGRRLLHTADVRRFFGVASREDLVAFLDLWRMMSAGAEDETHQMPEEEAP